MQRGGDATDWWVAAARAGPSAAGLRCTAAARAAGTETRQGDDRTRTKQDPNQPYRRRRLPDLLDHFVVPVGPVPQTSLLVGVLLPQGGGWAGTLGGGASGGRRMG